MKKIYLLGLMACSSLQAQNNTVPSGGDAIGSGGSSSYSVGQAFYQMDRVQGTSILQGLQQPIEIVPLETNHFTDNDPAIKIYPNPTFSGFYIALPDADYDQSKYILFDVNGKTVGKGNIPSASVFVPVEGLRPGIYFLNIDSPGKEQSFKIIKQ